jgi:hypothetical protein
MTRDRATMLEGLCWLLAGLGMMFAIVKFAITAQN